MVRENTGCEQTIFFGVVRYCFLKTHDQFIAKSLSVPIRVMSGNTASSEMKVNDKTTPGKL